MSRGWVIYRFYGDTQQNADKFLREFKNMKKKI